MKVMDWSDLRVVLVGYGLAGRVIHAPLISHTEGLDLGGVVTGNPERQRQVAAKFPDVSIFRNLNELLVRANDFDVAVIATPTRSHLPISLEAVRAGLHVVVDKPVAGTAADAELLGVEATKFDRQVFVFHNRRWDSDFLSIRKITDSGALGVPLVFESCMETLSPVVEGSWRNSPHPEDFGGSLLDLGSHLVDQAMELMGPIEAVSAVTHAVRAGAKADDFFSMVLVHTDSATSILRASRANPFSGFRFLVLGSEAVARVQWVDSQERALRDGIDPSSAIWGKETNDEVVEICSLSPGGERKEYFAPASRGEWNTFYSKVRDAIRVEQPSPVSIQDSIETMRVLDAARTSAVNDKTITLSPPARHGFSTVR